MAVKSIKEINDKYKYTDTSGSSARDRDLVSCGQSGSYNELQYIYDTYLKKHIEKRKITEQQALDALNSACMDLSNPRSRTAFYKYLSNKLGVSVG